MSSSEDSSSSDEEISNLVLSAYNKSKCVAGKLSDDELSDVSPTKRPLMKPASSSSSDPEISEMVHKAYRKTQQTSNKAKWDQSDIFIIDTKASGDNPHENIHFDRQSNTNYQDSSESSDDSDSSEEQESFSREARKKKGKKNFKLCSELKPKIDSSDIYVNVNSFHEPKKKMPQFEKLSLQKRDAEIMKKSVVTNDFEKQSTVPLYEQSVRQMKKQRRQQRQMSKGKSWFDLPLQEDEQRKNDLMILQMRNSLDPKRFYKGNDTKTLPKYYQFGTVIEGPAEFHSARIPKKQRKANLAEELLADAEFRKYNKRKYTEIQDARRKGLGAYKFTERPKEKRKRKKKTAE